MSSVAQLVQINLILFGVDDARKNLGHQSPAQSRPSCERNKSVFPRQNKFKNFVTVDTGLPVETLLKLDSQRVLNI